MIGKPRACEDCKQLLGSTSTCTFPYVSADGVTRARQGTYVPGSPFACNLTETDERCYDCGVAEEYVHHFGCEAETCPACGEAMATCGCEIERLEKA